MGIERVIRSDSGVAHRLSLSARVLSAADSQVKVKGCAGSASGACRIEYALMGFDCADGPPSVAGKQGILRQSNALSRLLLEVASNGSELVSPG
jgi:hypothetical protein